MFAAIIRVERNDYAKAIRKDYESGKIKVRRAKMKNYTILNSKDRGNNKYNVIANSLTTVQKDNLLLVET